jgi:hypothetical protein
MMMMMMMMMMMIKVRECELDFSGLPYGPVLGSFLCGKF